MKETKRFLALLLIAVMLLTTLVGCKKQQDDSEATSTSETTQATETTDAPTESTTEESALSEPAGYGNNTVAALPNYAIQTASPDDTVMTSVIAVDAQNHPLLTNAAMQICYWVEFYGFMNNYGEYAYLMGLDYSMPLAEQNCSEDRTWEQYFLEAAAQHYSENYALAQAAYANGYTLPPEDAAAIEEIADPNGSFAAEAAEAGYDSPEAYLKANFGDGVSIADYQDYLRMFYAAVDYYNQISQDMEDTLTDAEIEAYYDENAATYEESRLFKQNNVSVRHILISPEGDKDETLNDWTQEQWAAAETKAAEIYTLWQEDPSEENFAALATEYTDDTGSAENGGLYEDFATNAMVEEFSDWSFDPERMAGDTGIVKTTYGYHIMYFVEQTETRAWFDTARTDMLGARIEAYVTELCETYPVRFDYTLVRVFDMVSKMAAEETPQG